MPAKKTTVKKDSEATVITTFRVTSVLKVSNDQEKALQEVNAHQAKLLAKIKKDVDNLELLNERKYLNIKED